jgi:hypothetical protein
VPPAPIRTTTFTREPIFYCRHSRRLPCTSEGSEEVGKRRPTLSVCPQPAAAASQSPWRRSRTRSPQTS